MLLLNAHAVRNSRYGRGLCAVLLAVAWTATAGGQSLSELDVIKAARRAEEAARQAEEAVRYAEEALRQAEAAAAQAEEAARQAEQTEVDFAFGALRRQGVGTHSILAVAFIGDRQVVVELEGWQHYEKTILAAPISDADVETIQAYIQKRLQDKGYVFANVTLFEPALAAGVLTYRVSAGKVGKVVVAGNRHYSEEQIRRTAGLTPGQRFNYREFYDSLFGLNVKPDLEVDTTLDPVQDENGRRTVDVALEVEDKPPLHVAVDISDAGSKTTSDWRMRTSVQHLNLTKHDDVLSFEWLTDPKQVHTSSAVSGSYHLPWGAGNALTLYAGWSEADLDDVLPQLDIHGQGEFAGLRLSRIILDRAEFEVDTAVGWTYQSASSAIDLAGNTFGSKDLAFSMPVFEMGFSSKRDDAFSGRTYFRNTMMWSFAGDLGTSPKAEVREQMANADADVFINRFRAARFQRIPNTECTLNLRLDCQYSNSSLVPALQRNVGGPDSVRGYNPNEVAGDSGVNATIEFRTPLFTNFMPGLTRSPEFVEANPQAWSRHRMQLITFLDCGYVQQNDPIPGQQHDETFTSAGLGLRLSLGAYSQLKFDYGWPFEETEDSTSNGRGHVSLQLQF